MEKSFITWGPDISALGTSVDGDQLIKISTISHKAYNFIKIN